MVRVPRLTATVRVSPRIVVQAAALAVACTGVLWTTTRPGPRPPFLVIDESGGGTGLDTATGVMAVSDMVTLRVQAPFTLLRVAPLHVDPGAEFVDARVLFWGNESVRTPSGYLRSSSNPGNSCANGPITGHGLTYPVEGLRLRPGDTTAKVIFYLRSPTAGVYRASGYRIDYRTDDGRRHTISGENKYMEISLYQAGTKPPSASYYPECPEDHWNSPRAGFPV